MKTCYVVVVNYKRWEDTVACLRSLFGSQYPAIKALVVDNLSGNQSLEQIAGQLRAAPLEWPAVQGQADFTLTTAESLSGLDFRQLPDLLLVQNNRNAGFAAGNNLVLQYLQHLDGYVFLLNPDMTLHPAALQALSGATLQWPNAVFGLQTRSFDQPDQVLFYGGGTIRYATATVKMQETPTDGSQLDYISGGALFLDATTLKAVGLLPEDYFLYWEETDWCQQAIRKGYTLAVCPEAICYDKVSTVIGRGFLSDYYYTRNGLLFLRKYAKGSLPTALLGTFLRAGKRLLAGRGDRAKGMWRGVVDFLTGKDNGH
ncbi:MAG: glycosyltransferase family 2 protein [Candidatus Pseudobacter hemicellulosilyticus]|uniref:Glycosyltransferase family 2 protein n=1 Tax=Candidatus Pseudobacter hemicellulosilyticus TaxID=3121375 RepID=A0AAJ5WUE5_9BACT|nr:MAG: glycosyltransferase family 2 protein [Pseudobacter sp.]